MEDFNYWLVIVWCVFAFFVYQIGSAFAPEEPPPTSEKQQGPHEARIGPPR